MIARKEIDADDLIITGKTKYNLKPKIINRRNMNGHWKYYLEKIIWDSEDDIYLLIGFWLDMSRDYCIDE